MQTTPTSPFGAIVTGFDLRCEKHVAELWDLVPKYGVIVLPGNSFPKGAPEFFEKSNVSRLAKSLGFVPEYHPTNYFGKDGVQELATLGDGDRKPDAYLFHTDTSWVAQPSQVGMLTAKLIPPFGGNTIFVNSTDIYNLIPEDTKNKLHKLSAWHSYRTFYKRLDSYVPFKNEEDDGATHPAIVKHPVNGNPVLYVNENSTSHFLDMTMKESDSLLAELSKFINDNSLPRIVHKWSPGDVVLWDDIGMQHLARKDYKSRRIMMRAHAAKFGYRTERYRPEHVKFDFLQLLTSNSSLNKNEVIFYDSYAKQVGYAAPAVAAKYAMEYTNSTAEGKIRVLDMGGGTGLFGLEMLLRGQKVSCDYIDISPLMRQEAERKELYSSHVTRDVNEGIPVEDEKYDGVVSIYAIGNGQIEPVMAAKEAARVTNTDGFVIFLVAGNGEDVCNALVHCGVKISLKHHLSILPKMSNSDEENASVIIGTIF